MYKVIRKNYNAASSFGEAIDKIVAELNEKRKPYTIVHIENEKRYTMRTTRSDIPYQELCGGIAVVVVNINA